MAMCWNSGTAINTEQFKRSQITRKSESDHLVLGKRPLETLKIQAHRTIIVVARYVGSKQYRSKVQETQ